MKKTLIFLLITGLLLSCACSAPVNSPEEKPVVTVHSLFATMTLGDTVYESHTVAYGTIIDISEKMVYPPYIDLDEPGITEQYLARKVSIQVEEDLKNCKKGDIVFFWQFGGETPSGTIYRYEGQKDVKIGDKILAFIAERGDTYRLATRISDEKGKITVPTNYMQELRGKYAKEEKWIEVSMKEYLQKVKKVVQEQAKEVK